MSHFKHYKSGSVFGIIYTFDKAGEGLRMHSHQLDHYHNVVVLKGSVLFYGLDGARTIIEAGSIFDFDNGNPHEIKAREDETKILSIFLNGQPEYYNKIPTNEREGTFSHELVGDSENKYD